MSRLRILGLSVLLVAAAPAAPQSVPESVALVQCNVVDVRTGGISSGATVVLRNGKIESVGRASPPERVRIIDLKGKFLLPGLIDAHTHLNNLATARAALESGVTTVRSSGTAYYADVGLRELVRKGAIPGPDVVASGYHVRPRLAEEAFLSDPSLAKWMSGVDTAEGIREVVRTNLSHGVDFIKILATERAGTADTDPRKQVYSEDELRAAVDEAARKGVLVQAHAHGEEGAMAAVRAGVRSIEHGTYLSEAALQLMKEKGIFYVPTYTTVVDLLEPGGDYDLPALRRRAAHMLPRLRQTVRHAHEIGVRIVTGADTGYGPNSLTRISDEVVNLVEIGLSPLEAIRAATVTAAELLRVEKLTGAIEPGLDADLIAVEGNPLENPIVLRDALLVVSNGHIVIDRLSFGKAAQSRRQQ